GTGCLFRFPPSFSRLFCYLRPFSGGQLNRPCCPSLLTKGNSSRIFLAIVWHILRVIGFSHTKVYNKLAELIRVARSLRTLLHSAKHATGGNVFQSILGQAKFKLMHYPKFPQLWSSKSPHPVRLSLSRYECPRILIVIAWGRTRSRIAVANTRSPKTSPPTRRNAEYWSASSAPSHRGAR